MEKIVQHPHGLKRDSADYLIWGVLHEDGDTIKEQLWAKEVGKSTFRICCLPFYLYGISLGDIVWTDDALVVKGVLERSARSLLRFWFKDGCSSVEHMEARVAEYGAQFEWYSYRLASVDIPRERLASITQWLDANERELGLEYEVASE